MADMLLYGFKRKDLFEKKNVNGENRTTNTKNSNVMICTRGQGLSPNSKKKGKSITEKISVGTGQTCSNTIKLNVYNCLPINFNSHQKII